MIDYECCPNKAAAVRNKKKCDDGMNEEGIQRGFRWEGELSSKQYPVFACQFLITAVRVMRNLLISAQHGALFSLRIGNFLLPISCASIFRIRNDFHCLFHSPPRH